MMIAPVIFCVIVQGIASMERPEEDRNPRRENADYFEVVSTLALIIGIVVAVVFHRGRAEHDAATLESEGGGCVCGARERDRLHSLPAGFYSTDIYGALADGEVRRCC